MKVIIWLSVCLSTIVAQANQVKLSLEIDANTMRVEALSSVDVSSNRVNTGIEFFLRWPKSAGSDLVADVQSVIPGVDFIAQPVQDDAEEPETHYMQWFVYTSASGTVLPIQKGKEMELVQLEISPSISEEVLVELASSSQAEHYVTWFYAPFLDLTPSLNDAFYGDLVRHSDSGPYVYEGAIIHRKTVSTAIDETMEVGHFEIYPNPAQHTVVVKQSDISHTSPAYVNMYTASGSLVHSQILHNVENELSVENLTDGMYYVEINTSSLNQVYPILIER